MLRNKFIVNGKPKGLGYRKALNSHKDYSESNPQVKPMFDMILDSPSTKKKDMKKSSKDIDLSKEMSPVRDQGALGSCTAYAATAMVEYMQKKIYRKFKQCSTLFTYKTTRNLMQETGDVGAYMRSVMGSIAMCGVAPEEYWPYDGREATQNKKYDMDPPNFVYSIAQNFQSLRYVRLDQPDVTPDALIDKIKYYMKYMRMPCIIGFTCFESMYQSNDIANKGFIPFPAKTEEMVGGHAILLCGYDDDVVIKNKTAPDIITTGAFKFKNSWGTEWGQDGYGYLPYAFISERLADDVWVLISQEWVDFLQFME